MDRVNRKGIKIRVDFAFFCSLFMLLVLLASSCESTQSETNDRYGLNSKIGSNVQNEANLNNNPNLNQTKIEEIIQQYFDFSAKEKFDEILLIICKTPASQREYIEIGENKSANNSDLLEPSEQKTETNYNRDLNYKSRGAYDLNFVLVKKLIPKYINSNKLILKRPIKISVNNELARVEAFSESQLRKNAFFQTFYFKLIKDEHNNWKIFQIDLIDSKNDTVVLKESK